MTGFYDTAWFYSLCAFALLLAISAADTALYEAKGAGRNHIRTAGK